MTNKEQNMMKLVNYHFQRANNILSAKKQNEIFVGVYNHFNKRLKKNRIKKRELIIKYMNSLISNEEAKTVKHGRTIAALIGFGLTLMGLAALMTKKGTED